VSVNSPSTHPLHPFLVGFARLREREVEALAEVLVGVLERELSKPVDAWDGVATASDADVAEAAGAETAVAEGATEVGTSQDRRGIRLYGVGRDSRGRMDQCRVVRSIVIIQQIRYARHVAGDWTMKHNRWRSAQHCDAMR
jgi:hypothetical protein